ncbi:hypothetical protein ACQEVF_57400 [Nonomuraea polychroma]|uniref:hypothetical protein n=1 Tax=Nonomuraea polychroma TaxID=46176 RepID=UPI003D936FD5
MTPGPGVTVNGSGDTVTIGLSGETLPCQDVSGCVASVVGRGLMWAADQVGVRPSADVGNGLVLHADGVYYLPPSGGGSVDANTARDCVGPTVDKGLTYVTGTRTVETRLSAAAGNKLRYGADNGLAADAASANPGTAWATLPAASMLNGWTRGTPLPAWRRTVDGFIMWRGAIVPPAGWSAGSKPFNFPAGSAPTPIGVYRLAAAPATVLINFQVEDATNQFVYQSTGGTWATVTAVHLGGLHYVAP